MLKNKSTSWENLYYGKICLQVPVAGLAGLVGAGQEGLAWMGGQGLSRMGGRARQGWRGWGTCVLIYIKTCV